MSASQRAVPRPVTLQITFESPDSMMSVSEEGIHTREFEGVPAPVAQTIAADVVEYAKDRGEEIRQEIYMYRRAGAPDKKVMLPLDFKEVIGLSVAWPSNTEPFNPEAGSP